MTKKSNLNPICRLKCEPGAYEILNEKQEVIYVGSSADLQERYRKHKSMINTETHGNKKLQEFGRTEQLTFVPIPCATKEEAVAKEQELLDRNIGNGVICNISTSARATIYERSQEFKDKMSQVRSGTKRGPIPEKIRAKMAASQQARRLKELESVHVLEKVVHSQTS